MSEEDSLDKQGYKYPEVDLENSGRILTVYKIFLCIHFQRYKTDGVFGLNFKMSLEHEWSAINLGLDEIFITDMFPITSIKP